MSAGFSLVIATQLFAANLAQYFRLPGGAKSGATGYDLNFSFALLAVGHLVGRGWASPSWSARPSAGWAACPC